MHSAHGFALLLITVAAGCGSVSRQDITPAPSPDFGSSGPNGRGYTCVPDTDAGVVPRSNEIRTLDIAPCAPGSHAVATADDAGPPVGVASGDSGHTPPVPLPPAPALCTAGGANNEPKILVGYEPTSGATVGANGQIKVWVNDEGAPIIAPNEQVDPVTGTITAPGDRTAKAADGYLWEPALYIAPQTAENGGTPHFPTAIKGSYNNNPTKKGAGSMVPGMDPVPVGAVTSQAYTGEDIWDVSSLGLAPGSYIAEFVIHDGDHDRGVGCVTIVLGN